MVCRHAWSTCSRERWKTWERERERETHVRVLDRTIPRWRVTLRSHDETERVASLPRDTPTSIEGERNLVTTTTTIHDGRTHISLSFFYSHPKPLYFFSSRPRCATSVPSASRHLSVAPNLPLLFFLFFYHVRISFHSHSYVFEFVSSFIFFFVSMTFFSLIRPFSSLFYCLLFHYVMPRKDFSKVPLPAVFFFYSVSSFLSLSSSFIIESLLSSLFPLVKALSVSLPRMHSYACSNFFYLPLIYLSVL